VFHKIARLALRLFAATSLFFSVAAPRSSAQQAGVLLGYGEHDEKGIYIYKTAWIVFSPAEAHTVTTVPDIIVPRASGFWRLGVYTACEFQADTQLDSARQIVWQSALDKTPAISQGPLCKSHKPGDISDENSDFDPATSVRLCSYESAKLTFVSPTHISEEFDSNDNCDARGGHDQLRDDVRLIEGSTTASLADVLGAPAAQAYATAAKRGFAEISKEFNCPEPDPAQYDLKSWTIAHREGAWVPVANINQFQGECAFPQNVDLPLPKTITGESSKSALWRAFAAAVPHLSDFFLSPLGDYALVLIEPKNGEFHLYAYSIQNGPRKATRGNPWLHRPL
jgi:hypothetical protein